MSESKKSRVIRVAHRELLEKERIKSLEQIRSKIKSIFKKCIGEENGLTSQELFYRVYGIDANEMDMFKRLFWWKALTSVIATLRHEGEIFIISKKAVWFVLKTQAEADYFKNILDREIEGLQNAKRKADSWVRDQKWRKL